MEPARFERCCFQLVAVGEVELRAGPAVEAFALFELRESLRVVASLHERACVVEERLRGGDVARVRLRESVARSREREERRGRREDECAESARLVFDHRELPPL